MNEYTTITIAHKFETIKNSDRIYAFEHGVIK
jgi:ABC-type multidrug transport system fused ATPase/permease subunit